MKTEYLLNREIDLVLAALTSRNALIMRVALHTGLRVGDVLSITVGFVQTKAVNQKLRFFYRFRYGKSPAKHGRGDRMLQGGIFFAGANVRVHGEWEFALRFSASAQFLDVHRIRFERCHHTRCLLKNWLASDGDKPILMLCCVCKPALFCT